MIRERRILDALKESEIRCVALLDDAFDPPILPDEQMGALVELLSSLPDGRIAPDVEITRQQIDAALADLSKSEYASDDVLSTVQKLFLVFAKTGDKKLDPGGAFQAAKANNLYYVRPILELLGKCDPEVKIILCGSNTSEMDQAAKRAQLIFVDFFLNANLSPDGDPSEEQQKRARTASLERLRSLIKIHESNPDGTPAIILMSSHDVEHKMEEFRKEISKDRGDIFASRFEFLQKKQVIARTEGYIEVLSPALDSLLGIVQGFTFGRAIFLALSEWKAGADAAIGEVWGDINALKLKDFAYLTRFRLAQEGMGLSEYLEWFFSEYLTDAIARRVNWQHPAFTTIDTPGGPVTQVRGAFDGATDQVAVMFDRVRLEKPRERPRRNHRMGDIFLTEETEGGRRVRAILSPDCDLLIRKNGKPKAKRLLTVGGVLRAIDAPDAALADFLIVDGKSNSIKWDLKDVETLDFADLPTPGRDGENLKFAGSLRPLYANELRARVLDDLARFGLNVPPAIGSSASAVAVVEGDKRDFTFSLSATAGRAACSLVLSRPRPNSRATSRQIEF